MTEHQAVPSIDEFIEKANPASLPAIVQAIAALDDPIVREGYIGAVVKKLRVSKKILTQMIQATIGQQMQDDEAKPVVTANFDGLVDIATDVQGNAVFLVANYLAPGLYEHELWNDGTTDLVPPSPSQFPYLPPRAPEVFRHYAADDPTLFPDVVRYLQRFCYVNEGQALIVASMVFASYVQDHTEIDYLPIISLVGEPERGKSRLGMAATFASYRGVVLNGIREAHIIRLAEDFAATIFIDLRAAWKKVVSEKCEDLIMGRYEKGPQVMRVISPDKGAFADSRFFKAYGPTFIASNEPLDSILETRCISLSMENHPAEYEKPTEALGLALRERLVAWRAKMLSSSLPKVDQVLGLQGRYWDISSTLLRICHIVYPEGYETLKAELLRIAIEKIDLKRNSWEGTIVQNLLSLVKPTTTGSSIAPIKLADLHQKLLAYVPKGRSFTSQYLGLKLKAMGLKTKHVNGHSYIVIEKAQIDVFKQQYGVEPIGATMETKPVESVS